MTLSARIVESVHAQQSRGLDAALRRKAVLHCADTIGIAIAARDQSTIARQVSEVFGAQHASSPAGFAFVASANSHILDFDDVHDLARVHPTSVTLPAALAAASVSRATSTTASDIVEAVALSNEIACRFGMIWAPSGRGPGADWFLTQLFGYFSAALAASLVLRSSREQTRSALGLAYMQAAGGKEAGVGAGGTARAIYPAFASMGGVQAALLARAGIEGPPTALDGDAGFFPLYFGRSLDEVQVRRLVDLEGSEWSQTQFKLWPCCRHSHPYVFAAQALRYRANVFEADRIVADVNRSAAKLCTPLPQRRRPQTLQDAKYSIPFMIAFALVNDDVTLQSLDDSALADPRVLAVADRVSIEASGRDEPGLPAARLTMRMRGLTETLTFDAPFGALQTEEALERKFRSCLAYAGWPVDEVTKLWQQLIDPRSWNIPQICRLVGSAANRF